VAAQRTTTCPRCRPVKGEASPGSQALVSACLARAQGGRGVTRTPSQTLQALLNPGQPISEAGQETLARITRGMLDPILRLTKVIGAKSYVPLIPFIVTVSAWRVGLAAYPAAAPLVHELQDIVLGASRELDLAQATVAEAATKLEGLRGAFPGDSKGVKDIGVLPRTRQLAADCVELLAILQGGLPALHWWWPWSQQVYIRLVHDCVLATRLTPCTTSCAIGAFLHCFKLHAIATITSSV
jgi:hypothetical protein